MYHQAISKYTFQKINSEELHYLKTLLIKNRNIRNQRQNKLGPHLPQIGWFEASQTSYLYIIKTIYNDLPRNITLSPNYKIFKKWIKRYYIDKNVKLPSRDDSFKDDIIEQINVEIITECEEGFH